MRRGLRRYRNVLPRFLFQSNWKRCQTRCYTNYLCAFKEPRPCASQCKQDCFGRRLWKRSAVLICPPRKTPFQQSMPNLKKNEGDKSCLNEPGNVMHLAQRLWWKPINSNINARIWVALHVSRALRLSDNAVVLFCLLALLKRSPETRGTYFPAHPFAHRLCSTE